MDRTFLLTVNRPAPGDPLDIPPAEASLPINIEMPTRKEIRKALEMLEHGKASGSDDISTEALKANLDTATEIFHSLFEKI